MPKGYAIASARVTDPVKWTERNTRAASGAMKIYGGNPIVRGGRCEVREGQGSARNVVIEFESCERALAYASSPDYGEAKKRRDGAGTLDMVIIEAA